jgi:hypothetical protein
MNADMRGSKKHPNALHQTGGFLFSTVVRQKLSLHQVTVEVPDFHRDLPWEFKPEALQHPEPDIP